MTLREPHSGWRLPQASVMDVKEVGLDQMLTRLWLRVLHENKFLAPRVDGHSSVTELAQLMERPGNEKFEGFERTGVAEAWLRSDLVKTLKRKPETFTVARPVHDGAIRLRNPGEDKDSNASLVVYGWLAHCDPELLSELQAFLKFDESSEDVDLATYALGVLGEMQMHDSERSGDPEPSPKPLCIEHGRIYADDLRRLLAYQSVMPRADLVDHIRKLTGVHLGLYLLKVFRITVDAESSGGQREQCATCSGEAAEGGCPYKPEAVVDCGEDARSPVAKLAEISWAGEEEGLARYIRSHIALRKLWEFAEPLQRRHPKEALPIGTIDEIAAVEKKAKSSRIDAHFSERFDDLVNNAKGLEDKSKARQQEEEIRELENEYLSLGMSSFRAYVALLAHYSSGRWLNYHRYLLDSLFGKNSADGMLRQPLGGRRRRRLSMAPGILETLTLVAVVADSPSGYVSRPIRIDLLMERFDNRYGFLIGRPPTEFADDPTVAGLLRSNVLRFKARLRETGLYTDLSDAFLAQTVKPRYVIGADR